jgi:hypothetical protein
MKKIEPTPQVQAMYIPLAIDARFVASEVVQLPSHLFDP